MEFQSPQICTTQFMLLYQDHRVQEISKLEFCEFYIEYEVEPPSLPNPHRDW